MHSVLKKKRTMDQNKLKTSSQLHQAITNHDNDSLSSLLDNVKNINERYGETKRGLLVTAILAGNSKAAEMLIKAGCDINLSWMTYTGIGIQRTAPLIFAIMHKNSTIAKLLIEAGCDINVRDEFGNTTAGYAISNNCEDVLQSLFDAGYDINQKDGWKKTPLFSAVDHISIEPKHGSITILKLIMDYHRKGQDMTVLNDKNESPLTLWLRHYGDMNKYSHHTIEFYDKCFDILASDMRIINANLYALPLAVEYGTLYSCAKLLAIADCVNQYFKDGESSLHCAIRIDSVEKCLLLIRHKANLNATWQGMTPLEFAISLRSHPKIIETLMSYYPEHAVLSYLKDIRFLSETPYRNLLRLKVQDCAASNLMKAQNRRSITTKQCYMSNDIQTKLPINEQRLNEKQVLKMLICAHSCNNIKESKDIIKCTTTLLEELSLSISRDKKYAHFRFKVRLAGSMAERTKTFCSNEIDAICEFIESPILIDEKLKVFLCSPWITSTGLGPVLNSCAVSQTFYKVCKTHLSKIKPVFKCKHSGFSLSLHSRCLVLKNKISCLQLLWNGCVFKNMIVHVDLVPAFIDEKPVLYEYVLPAKGVYHRIAKVSRKETSSKHFMLSHACVEVNYIKNLPMQIKLGLIVAKALRMAAVSKHAALTGISENESINVDDFITSYMLKTCLIEILKDSDNQKGTAYDWADRIYCFLEQSLEYGTLYSYNDDCGDDFIVRCDHLPDSPMKSCCLERKVILELCYAIRAWLRKNKSELEHLTYGAHLVYSRNRRQYGTHLVYSRRCTPVIADSTVHI